KGPAGRIRIISRIKKGQVEVEIADNGPGIAPEIQSRIFEPFFTTKAVDEGTGIGLALSHRIVDSHHGNLFVDESELGGATFVVSLPLADRPATNQSASTPASVSLATRALLVEDEPEVAEVFKKLFESVGISIMAVGSAEEALALLEKDRQFQLIVSDLRMPGMSGLDLLRLIENRWPFLSRQLVFVTGDSISEEAEIIRAEGTHKIYEKPLTAIDLDSIVGTLRH
ncbi:MAG: response regulator, partial [Gammaproteobacteria bacterium]|nr:response regulator [Gammaproteobacteria bacterium]